MKALMGSDDMLEELKKTTRLYQNATTQAKELKHQVAKLAGERDVCVVALAKDVERRQQEHAQKIIAMQQDMERKEKDLERVRKELQEENKELSRSREAVEVLMLGSEKATVKRAVYWAGEMRDCSLSMSQGELLTFHGLGTSRMNSQEVIHTILKDGMSKVDAASVFNLPVSTSPSVFVGFLIAALEDVMSDMEMEGSLVALRMLELLMEYLRGTAFEKEAKVLAARVQTHLLSESKFLAAYYDWIIERKTTITAALETRPTINVGDVRMFIEGSWLFMIQGLTVIVAADGRYAFSPVPKPDEDITYQLAVDDFRGSRWSHEWTLEDLVEMGESFALIFPLAEDDPA